MNRLVSPRSADIIDWGVASRPLTGEVVQGDNYFVGCDGSRVLVVVVDALGHGMEAAKTADLAVETVALHAHEPIVSIFQHCHTALRRTRGAAMSAAMFCADDHTVSWLGIGNVEGVVVRQTEFSSETRSFVVRGGVVGYQLPRLSVSTVSIARGDALVIATDGLKLDFVTSLGFMGQPQSTANHLLAKHGKPNDDALVLIARYVGVRE